MTEIQIGTWTMNVTPTKRISSLPPYSLQRITQQIGVLLAAGHTITRFDIGSPDLPPPPHVIEALVRCAYDSSMHGYTGYRGSADFREAVATYYSNRHDIALNPDTEVLPLIGSKEGLYNLSMAFLEPGDIALIPEFSYPVYARSALLAGAEVVHVPMPQSNTYELDISAIPPDIAKRAKILWMNYPNNPTGAVIDEQTVQGIVTFCIEHNIILASDNAYLEITYDGYRGWSVFTIPDARKCAIEFLSLSKTYNMAGWRLGAAAGNPEVVRLLMLAKSNIDTGHFMPIYAAGCAALLQTPQSWIDERNTIYRERRDRLVAALPDIGLSGQLPRAAMYVWAKVNNGHSGEAYAAAMLNQAHVSLVPGTSHGPTGQDYVRFSFCLDTNAINEGLDRAKEWYDSWM